jgi:hypothetical protein
MAVLGLAAVLGPASAVAQPGRPLMPGLATRDDASALAQAIMQSSFVGFGIQCAGASELCGWKRIPGGTNGRRGGSHRRAPPKPVK